VEFKRQWEGLTEASEQVKKFSLGVNDLQCGLAAAPVVISSRLPMI
jgi:hypothetical protein